MNAYEEHDDPSDSAIIAGLARLGSVPVDTSNLDRKLRGMITPPAAARAVRPRQLRGLAAVAASLLLIVGASLALRTTDVRASATDMAQMHQDILSGKIPTMKARSVDEANHAIAAMDGPPLALPQVPAAHAMACCLKSVKNKRVACLLLDDAGTPVTLVAAAASDMASPAGEEITRGPQHYLTQTVNQLQMVMTKRQNHWVCLISSAPRERLMDLADSLKF